MVLALQVPEEVSRPRNPSHTQGPNLRTISPFAGVEDEGTVPLTPMARMLRASRLAQDVLTKSEINLPLLRLQTKMCYITLHLTLVHAIMPELRSQHPQTGVRDIDHMKYAHFYNQLRDDPHPIDNLPAYPPSFKTNISFRKSFWGLIQELGVASLLMLAVADTGPTMIARSFGPQSRQQNELVSTLCCARGWWAFAHAIGPATLRTFFGPRDIHYTVPQLVQLLRNEPLPAIAVRKMNGFCHRREIKVDIETEVSCEETIPLEWALQIGQISIAITRYPLCNPPLEPKKRRVNIWEGLASDPRLRPIVEFLQPPGEPITDTVIEFFCSLYNQRAVPGRIGVAFSSFIELCNPGYEHLTHQERLDNISNKEGSKFDMIVFPVPIDMVPYGVILFPKTDTAKVYNWIELRRDRELAEEVEQVI